MRIPTHREPTHPGEVLIEEFLKPVGISQLVLSRRIRVPYRRVNDIVNRRRGVTPATAVRLSRYFGTTPGSWMNLQLRRDLYHALVPERDALRRIRPLRTPVQRSPWRQLPACQDCPAATDRLGDRVDLRHDLPYAWHAKVAMRFTVSLQQRDRRREELRARTLAKAQRAAQALRERFVFRELHAIWSILDPRFRLVSDVDLVVSGLDARDFHRAHAFLMDEIGGNLPIDLRALEDLPESFQRHVQEQGLKLA